MAMVNTPAMTRYTANLSVFATVELHHVVVCFADSNENSLASFCF